MNKRLRKILTIVFALIFVGSLCGLLWNELDQQKGKEAYEEAETLVGEPDFSALPPPTLDPLPQPEEAPDSEEPAPVYVDPYADLLRNMDFSALREINSDVLGWLLVPGTNISYPLLGTMTSICGTPGRRITAWWAPFSWRAPTAKTSAISTPSSTDTGCGTAPCSVL